MAQLFLTPIDLGKLELLNGRFQNLGSDPGTPTAGQFYWNTGTKRLRVYDGTSAWIEMGAGAGTVTGITLTQPASGLTVTNSGTNQTTAATATFALANDLAALEGLGSTGYAVRTGVDTWAQRTLTGTTNQVSITNGDGTSGNPVFSLPQSIHTAATPTFASLTISNAPSAASDATRKDYVDGLLQGIKWKNSVRAATAAAGTLASSFANGSVIDTSVTLATNDRILIKDQAAPAENGIYIVQASGAPVRALDMDAWTEVPGATVLVELGTANADTSWVCTADQGGTLNTTSITFVKMASAIGLVDAGTKITGILPVLNGGTGGSSVATAKTSLGFISRFVDATIGGATSQVVTHNLGTRDVTVMVRETAGSYAMVQCQVEMTSINTVTLSFAVAPSANQFTCIVMG